MTSAALRLATDERVGDLAVARPLGGAMPTGVTVPYGGRVLFCYPTWGVH